jgi:hypothetical protein
MGGDMLMIRPNELFSMCGRHARVIANVPRTLMLFDTRERTFDQRSDDDYELDQVVRELTK